MDYIFGEVVPSSDQRAQTFINDGGIESVQKTLKKYHKDDSKAFSVNFIMMIMMTFAVGIIVAGVLTVHILPHVMTVNPDGMT